LTPAAPAQPAASAADLAAPVASAAFAADGVDRVPTTAAPTGSVPPAPPAPGPVDERVATSSARPGPRPGNAGPAPTQLVNGGNGCTAPQLRRFIKSRPYVPMHELRRRFAIEGGDDDVTQVHLDDGHIYVGLPEREGALLGELLRGGEIGFELSLDPRSPIVIGVYPMRPIPRS
jgi:hypothetical protein